MGRDLAGGRLTRSSPASSPLPGSSVFLSLFRTAAPRPKPNKAPPPMTSGEPDATPPLEEVGQRNGIIGGSSGVDGA